MKHRFLIAFLSLNCLSVLAQVKTATTPAVEDDQPYLIATKMPEFAEGGSQGMIEFIQEHLEYPMAEKKAHIQAELMMQFIVEKDGSLSDIKCIKGGEKGHESFVKEATRVIKMMPKWKPGAHDGHNVRVYKNVPFYFVLAQKKATANHDNHHSKQTTTPHK